MSEYCPLEWIDDFENMSQWFSFNKLNEIIDNTHWVLELLGDNAQSQPQISSMKNKIFYLDVEFFLAANNTLKSILSCCRLGNFSDANVLTRKYRDDLFQYLFIIFAIKKIQVLKNENEVDLTNEMIKCIDNLDSERVLVILESINQREKKRERSKLENGIDAWFENKLEENSNLKEFFSTQKYKSILCENILVKECFHLYLDEVWSDLSKRLNNYTHGNGKNYIFDNAYHCKKNSDIQKKLDGIGINVWQITASFLSVLILLNPNYIMSSDLLDHLDMGLTPPEDAQYLVAPIFQDYMDTYITKINPELKDYLRDNNPYGMKIK